MELSPKGKLFIGGLSWDTSNEGLRNYFSKYGEVVDAVIMRDRLTSRSRGFGFVTFNDDTTAEIVAQETHVIDGRTIEAKTAVSREEMAVRGFKTRKIFVGGLSINTTEEEFKNYFEQFGNVMDAQIMLERETGRPRGFGFVTFEKEESVEKVLLHNHEISGKTIEVKKAQPKTAFLPPFGGPFRSMGGGGSLPFAGETVSPPYYSSGPQLSSPPIPGPGPVSSSYINSHSTMYSPVRAPDLYSYLPTPTPPPLPQYQNRNSGYSMNGNSNNYSGGHNSIRLNSGYNNYSESGSGNYGYGYGGLEVSGYMGGRPPHSSSAGGSGPYGHAHAGYNREYGGPGPSFRSQRQERHYHPYHRI
eukprot:TRINITY_DN10606_c0_g1_i1.p1 TRINITY_DN10606_c0_g1~~TRINITY_DN10606_c0_g1_i1.p1  ORF type:complete len:359 (+),score=38.85 TRINITY_DN10606_c0_g1_i1:118-1194(+)